MRSILDWLGCYDAAAETINARWGGGANKSMISKKAKGNLDWTIADVIALEDASGRYPVTKMMARRLEDRNEEPGGDLLSDGSSIAKESGEAISWVIAAEQSNSADDLAQAIKEIDEAVESLDRARSRILSKMGDASSSKENAA